MLIENKNKVTARIGKRSAPATGTVSSAGNNEIVAAPAATHRHIIEGWQYQSIADGDQTVLLKIGSDIFDGVVTATKPQGKSEPFVEYVGAPGAPIVLNLSAAVTGRYFIWSRIEPVGA